jgi:hypothetical protein
MTHVPTHFTSTLSPALCMTACSLFRRGLDTKQIATQMQLPEALVYNAIHRARESERAQAAAKREEV